MNRFLIVLFLAISFFHTASAQKKEMAQVQNYLKTGKNLDKAESIMRTILSDSVNRTNIKAWLLLYGVIKKQYDEGNEKLYLKQPYDTAAIFNLTQKMFETLESLDSVELSLRGGAVHKLKYRKKHAEILDLYRPNLYNGGTYYVLEEKYDKAYRFFSHYIDTHRLPIFSEYQYLKSDTLIPQAAYWTVYCGYKMQKPVLALKYISLAVKDLQHYSLLLQYIAETYRLENKTDRYLETLKVGFTDYPTQSFFYTRLIEYYSKKGDWTTVNNYADQARIKQPEDKWLQVAKSTALLNTERYDNCIALCDSIIAADKNIPQAYLNAGLAYFNQAVEIEKDVRTFRNSRKQITAYYQHALPYMEQYRKLMPSQEKLWILPLYTIYLNLNMGKEFDEINRLIKSTAQQ